MADEIITDDNKETQEIGDEGVSDELLELKNELADVVVSKLLEKNNQDMSLVKEGITKIFLKKYLVDDGSFEDLIFDRVGVWMFLKNLITPSVQKYREKISGATDKDSLDKVRTEILNELDWVKQEVIESNESSGKSDNTETEPSTSSDESHESELENDWSDQSSNQKNNETGKKDDDKSSDGNKSDKSDKTALTSNENAKESSGESHEIDHFNITVSSEKKNVWNNLKWKEKPNLEPFACALKVFESLKSSWKVKNTKYLTVVDFSKSRWTNRFFVINMETNTVEYATKVGHWKWSWWTVATKFSNTPNTNQSSLWWYITPDEIRKSTTKSWSWLRMNWLEDGINDKAANRWIYMHPWSEAWSLWCFTLPKDIAHEIMNKLKWWSVLFAFAKTKDYFNKSKIFQSSSDGSITA